MTTIAVVRKGNQIAIASDSLVTFGDLRLANGYEANEKIIHVGESWIGLAGSTAHFSVVKRVLAAMDPLKLNSRDEVFDTFVKAHAQFKEQFFMNPKEEDDDPYESSHLTCLIANPSGIYGVYSYREVFSFDRFWAIGSGRAYAIGAMHASFDRLKTAGDVARAGIEAGIQFDKNSAGPVRVFHTRAKPVAANRRGAATDPAANPAGKPSGKAAGKPASSSTNPAA